MALKNNVNLEEFPSPGDRYNLDDCLGCGAYGKVFTATDTQASDKKVAIKTQKLSKITELYIKQEYKVLRDLSSHTNLPDFYGIYRKEGEIWFVMELCEGGPVIDLVNGLLVQNRRMAEEHIAYILKETVKAAMFLHESCIVHRDIKAKNILVTRDGEIKLTDFNLSASLPAPMAQTSTIIGSPCWVAPEIITSNRTREKYDNRADVWSLGITAIELGDGRAPYQGMHPTRALFQITTNPPPTLYRPSHWSENYVDFINECLVKNPEYRPYMVELIDHPFLTQIPENNYHLTLELKSLVNDANKLDLPKAEPETVIVGNCVKGGVDGELEAMYVDDLASLDKINEETILKHLETRFRLDQFYTFIGDVLMALNPNEKKNIFGEEYHQKYHFKSRSDNAPHIFATVDSAYQNALHHMVPQRIVLSGESGSGKTSNYLHIIDHLLFLGENTNINLDRLKGAIKLIHSLTHASTPINDYSTRCVIKTDIKYGSTGKVTGAIFNVAQLEKWRVSSVDMVQGNFHILYYIYDGLQEMKKLEQYYLNSKRQHRYLRIEADSRSNIPKHDINRNLTKFRRILKILEDFEFREEQIDTFFRVIAAVLTIGEIRFQEDFESAIIENSENIEKLSALLKIEANKLEWAFTNYCVIRKGAAIRKKSSVDEARDARDVFANTLYARFVDYIVEYINHKLETGKAIFGEKYSIQVFDYYGFECFKTNHLPQLLVNTFNEQLHYHYLQRVFSWECLDMNEEEMEYQPLAYYDNKKTLDQLMGKPESVLTYIDEASKMGQHGKYVIGFILNSESKRVSVSGSSEFSIAHYTGKVPYCATEMPDKNRDFLPPEIIETLRLSDDRLIKMLFTNKLNKAGNLIITFEKENELKKQRYNYETFNQKNKNQYSQIRKMRTSINTFKAFSLETLKQLSIGSSSGGTHFVHCIRSNLKGEPSVFDSQLIRQQMRALAITETAKARQRGYPHRIPFQEFLRRYQFLAFDFNENVEVTRENCRLLFIRLKMEDWAIGKSKVFLKYYNEEYLARLYETQVNKIIKIQSILRKFLAKCRVAKQIKEKENECLSVIGKKEKYQMTEEEAAAIIQKAYREATIRKSYPDFAKDYTVLDEETCNFIRKFADRWRRNSLFHVLLLYRAMRLQDMFNFAQQVHFYNIGVFYQLQEVNKPISLDLIDTKAQASHWLGEAKPSVQKVPFRLDEIPFYDTSGMCNLLTNPGVSIEKDDSWDLPYRWRELVSSKASEAKSAGTREEENLIHVPYHRDPNRPIIKIEHIEEKEEDTENIEKEEQNKAVFQRRPKEVKKINENIFLPKESIPKSPLQEKKSQENNDINSSAKLANKDFDYIKPPMLIKPKSVDPVAELKQIGQKNSSEDEPPFNFRGMLRKTNFKKDSVKRSPENVTNYSLRKVEGNRISNSLEQHYNIKNLDQNGILESIEKRVTLELAPGITLEGVEVEL